MLGWADLRDRIQRYFSFSEDETRLLLLYILVLGFVVGFNDGSTAFSMFGWLRNFANSLVVVALALLVHETAHRVVGLYLGQQVTLAFWAPGLIAGVVLAMFSNGEIVFLVSGAITVKMMEVARLGKFRYGLSYNDLGVIAAAGPVANVGLAVVLRLLEFLPGGGLLHQAMMVNLVFALCNMLPIPPLDGAQFLFASRSWYVFTFAGIAAMTALLLLTNALLAVLGALLIGFLVFLVFFVMVETK